MFPTSSRTFDVLHFLLHKFYWNFFAEFKCIMWSLLWIFPCKFRLKQSVPMLTMLYRSLSIIMKVQPDWASARAKSDMLDYSRTKFSQIQPRHNVASIRGKVHDLDFCQSSGQEHAQKQHRTNRTRLGFCLYYLISPRLVINFGSDVCFDKYQKLNCRPEVFRWIETTAYNCQTQELLTFWKSQDY